MKISTQDYGEVTVAELQGELDCDSVGLFDSTVTETVSRGRTGIVLDMSKIGFVDGEGLERLLWARDYCGDNGVEFRLAGLGDECLKILEVTRLEKEFDQHRELAKAVKSIA
jgi:anti-anti-sigma factor